MSVLRRVLTGACTTVLVTGSLLAGGATPASAHDSTTCRDATSAKFLTANDGDFKLWIDNIATPTGFREYHVCFGVGSFARGDLLIREPLSGTLVPSIELDPADDNCPALLDIENPIELVLRFGQTLTSGVPGFVCFGIGDGAIRLTLGGPAPVVSLNVDLFLDANTTLWGIYCAQFPASSGCPTGTFVRINIV